MSITSASAQSIDWAGVEKIFGRKGIPQGEMFKVTFPRTDLSVRIGEVTIEPGLALTSWIGFQRTGMSNNCSMMGDLVLREEEVGPVTTQLIAEGIQITAIHNHLIGSRPCIIYVHFSGEGDAEKLSAAMRPALAATGTPMTAPVLIYDASSRPDWTTVEKILGKSGQKKGNLLQMGFPREEKIMEEGMVVPPYLGVASSVNMQRVGGKAAATGDFVLIGTEVNPVITALAYHGIITTAVHSHMLFETPRLFFLHFWGYDEPAKLARGLKAALNQIKLAK